MALRLTGLTGSSYDIFMQNSIELVQIAQVKENNENRSISNRNSIRPTVKYLSFDHYTKRLNALVELKRQSFWSSNSYSKF